MKYISDRDIICHQPYMNPEVEIDLNRNKSVKMVARNRRPMAENMDNSEALGVQRIHRSSRKLRLILHEFCQKFLADCYNGFMGTVKANLSRGAAQDHDETYYVWAKQFFMEFNRHRPKATAEERYRQVYETMATSTFHYLQTLVDDYLDHLAQKKLFKLEMSDWSKRLHCALRSYRELLFSLSTLSGLDLVEAQKMCHRIKQDIFTEPDYREMLLRLLQAYNEERMSKAYLRDLIETNHVFLKMLDYHAKISFDFKVKFKKRKRKAPKKAKKLDEPEPEVEPEEEPVNPDELWTELIDEVSNVLQSKTLSEESVIGEHEELRELFDPLTDASLDDQKLGAMRKVCQLLRKKEVESAIRLFREARHALAGLDDENAFGEIGIAPEDELLALNEVMMVEFPEEEKKKKVQEEENDEEVDEEEEEEEAFRSSSMHEAAFSLEDTVRRYAHPNVLRAYRLMLRNYKSNSIMTNHSIVRMLYRIAVDLKMVPMFYNFGYFLIFESILADPLYAPARAPTKKPSSSLESVVEELGQFARFVTRKFFKLLEKYPNIPCELCFAANSRDSYAMEMGFDEQQVAALLKEKKKKILWTDEQELELEVLVKECRDKVVATNKDKDLVDLVQEKLMDESKTRRQILKKLKEMGLLQESDLKTKTSWKGPAWTVDELVELRQLYQKFKDVQDFSEFAPSLPIVQEDSADKPPPLTTMIEESFSVEPPLEVPVDEGQDKEVSEEGPKDVDETPKEPPTDDVPVQEGDDDEASNDKNQSKKVQPKPKRADIIDAILQGLTTRDKRNRRQVMRQLKSMNIYDHSGGKKWTPEHLEELRTVFCNLFIDYKEHRDKEEEETFRNEEEESSRNDEEESSQNEENDKEKSSYMKEKKKRKVLIDDDDSGMEEEEESSKKNQEDLEESSQKDGEESSPMEVGQESSGKNEDTDPQDEQSIDKSMKKKRAVLFDSDDEEEDESSKKNKEGDEESSLKDEEEGSSHKNEDKKQETSREDFNFSLKFQSKFSDKTKSWSQILRQLKKMGFDESLKTMGLIKAGGRGGRGNDEKKSTFVGNEFVDSSGSSDEEEEVERPEVDDDKDDDSSDDEGQRSHQRDKSRSSRTTKNYSMFEREDVVVQYDSEDDDSREVSTTTIKASRTSMELAAILEDIPDVVEDASQPEDHVIKSSEVKSSVSKSSVSLQVDESESAQKKKAKLSENKKKLERLRQFMINNDNGDESDDEEEEESSPKEEISRKKEEKVADKKKLSSSDKQSKKKKRKVLIDEDDSDKEEEEESSRKDEDSDSSSAQDEPIDKKKSMKKKRAVLIDSDNEEEEESSRKDEEEENLSLNDDSLDKNQKPRSNKRKLIDSDDDEESSQKNEDKNDDSMMMQVDDDDKEEEESSYQSKNKKKRVILDDDDE